MADRIFDPDEPTHAPNQQDFDGSWHTFGNRAPISEACDLTGWAAYCPNPKPANYRWIVYKFSDESIVAEVDLAALTLTPGAWNSGTSADFDDPGDVALDDEEEYFVGYATNGDFVFRDSGLAFPYGTGIVTATEAGFFNGGTGPTFPDSFSTAFMFPVDMIVEAGGAEPNDGTIQHTAPAGVTAAAGTLVDPAAVAAASPAGVAAHAGTLVDPGSVAAAAPAGIAAGEATLVIPAASQLAAPAGQLATAAGLVNAGTSSVTAPAGIVAAGGTLVNPAVVAHTGPAGVWAADDAPIVVSTPGRHTTSTSVSGLVATSSPSRLTATTGP